MTAVYGRDRFVVSDGMPHLAPVLRLEDGQVCRRYLRAYLCARDEGDRAAEDEVGSWLAANPSERDELLCLLMSWAEITAARVVYGLGVGQAMMQIVESRCGWVTLHSGAFDPRVIEGCVAGPVWVQHMLSREVKAAHGVAGRLVTSHARAWGAMASLADMVIGVARVRWGSAAQWIATLRYLSPDPPTGFCESSPG